jgi:RNA polymerase sigma factor (TIGR02999 family)
VPPDASDQRETVTGLIRGMAGGDAQAAGQLFGVVYDELRAIAAAQFRHERAGHTLQPTALVNEAFMKLVDEPTLGDLGRREFFSAAARAMRRILIDHARASRRLKRGGGQPRFALADDPAAPAEVDRVDVLAVDEALAELAAHDERKARLVELRFFGGLSMLQVCEVLGISRATADREWRTSRAWLAARLEGAGDDA